MKPCKLIIEYPSCGLCREETSHDGDVLFCDDCNLCWPEPSGLSEKHDEVRPECGAVSDGKGWAPKGSICGRGEDHAGYHHSGWWDQ